MFAYISLQSHEAKSYEVYSYFNYSSIVLKWRSQHIEQVLSLLNAAIAFPKGWNNRMDQGLRIEVMLGFLTSTQSTAMSDRS
jgi:hypothetical protein